MQIITFYIQTLSAENAWSHNKDNIITMYNSNV